VKAAKPIPVNWVRSDEVNCGILGQMGMSTKCIMEQTGLTYCQVTYRLKRAGVVRKDYRDGISNTAMSMMRMAMNRPMAYKVEMLGVVPNKKS
jgi:hypothetical protein